ncbi:hypothetical protein GQR88_00005 [Burkholderia glumae AU6208]|nr:hypothetical protein GQR88_00005 [Burkholderia glumae AU6208]
MFADTGNEHEATYAYALDYLPSALGITVDVVRADFADEFATKRARTWRGSPPASPSRPSTAIASSCTRGRPRRRRGRPDLLHPTGNPFLDLCMVRGGFPSRKRQFCTEYLKRNPLTEYAIGLIDAGFFVESWQGVRARTERRTPMAAALRMARWPLRGVPADPALERRRRVRGARGGRYRAEPAVPRGHVRVGCMPCINAQKGEIREIARRFPEHIGRIAAWERLVSEVCRPRSPVSFFHLGTQSHAGQGSTIEAVVRWSKTTRARPAIRLTRGRESRLRPARPPMNFAR